MAVNDVRRQRFRAIARAYVDAAAHLPAILAKRRHVQASRRVAVGYIDSIIVHPLPYPKTLLRVAKLMRWRR